MHGCSNQRNYIQEWVLFCVPPENFVCILHLLILKAICCMQDMAYLVLKILSYSLAAYHSDDNIFAYNSVQKYHHESSKLV